MSENLQRLHRALAERGFVLRPPPEVEDPLMPVQLPGLRPMVSTPGMNVPQPSRPFSTPPIAPPRPATPTNEDGWEIEDSFTPEGLAAAAGEGQRFFGDLLAPIGDAALGLGKRVNDWHMRRGGEMAFAQDRLQDHQRDLRAANVNTARMQQQSALLERMDLANGDDAESRMHDLRGQLDSRVHGGTPAFTTMSPRDPEDMDDDELLAMLQRGRAAQ